MTTESGAPARPRHLVHEGVSRRAWRWAVVPMALLGLTALGAPVASALTPETGPVGLAAGSAGVVGGPRLASTGIVVAAGVGPPPVTDAASFVVADYETGDVLAAKAPHEALLPASTLKILTALTLLPVLDPEEIVVGTDEAAAVDGSKAGIDPGLKYSIDLVFKAMMLQSGNDAAVTLALAAGGVEQTVAAMNDVAAGLQALDTLAANPSGLDAPGQLSSAYDLALITRAALARDDFRTYITTETAQMPDRAGGTYQIQNENRFLAGYDGAIGVKNGYTEAARHTFVGAAQRDGRTLIVTVMRTEDRPEVAVTALMDWGFANAASTEPVGRLVDPDDPAPAAKAPPPTAAATGSLPGAGPASAAVEVTPLTAGAAVEADEAGGIGWMKAAALLLALLAGAVVLLRARVLLLQRARTRRPR